MTSFAWVRRDVVLAIHEEQMAEHGGLSGLRDPGRLDSALARARNLAAHGERVDLASLTAAYTYGLARSQAFADGNKRVALVVGELFLALHGMQLVADDAECVLVVLAAAAGDIGEETLAGWFRRHLAPIEKARAASG